VQGTPKALAGTIRGAGRFRYIRPVHAWRTVYEFGTEARRHTIDRGEGHALLSPLVAWAFKVLGVSAAIWEHGPEWWPIHVESNVIAFEVEHGHDRERVAHNARKMAEACRRRKTVRGEHAGLSDLFVPIIIRDRAVAVLATGPFATSRPSSADVLDRWRFLTGRQGQPGDPEFAAYLSATLAVLVLEGPDLPRFEELLGCFALLMSGERRADDLMNRVEVLQRRLEQIRLPERMWQMARTMVDDRSPNTAVRYTDKNALRLLGLTRAIDHVVVGLTRSRKPIADVVDEAIRRNAFQRAAVELARKEGEALSGKVGDHGIVLLTGAAQAKKRRALALAHKLAAIAGRFGFSLHVGVSASEGDIPPSRTYQSALGAGESALSQNLALVHADPSSIGRAHPLRAMRRELGGAIEIHPQTLGARFERYLEVVAIHCGYRMEAAKTHLEVGFDRMAEALQAGGGLDAKTLIDLSDALDRSVDAARTLDELFAAYRLAIADLAAAATRPVSARHDRGLRAALDYMRQHYAEPLRAATVARVAGLSPKYFSRLFRDREGTTFETALLGLRVERAKSLLDASDLSIERVARLSGFGSSQYFCRVFKRVERRTPLGYRRHSRA
jgi:AraC-like DNA-binding protein